MKAPKCRVCGVEHWGSVCPTVKSKTADLRGIAAIDSFEDVKAETLRPVHGKVIVGVDPASRDFGARVIGRVMDDGRIEILSVSHSKAKFSKQDYQKRYMADLRTIKRLGLSVTVAQYRKSKET